MYFSCPGFSAIFLEDVIPCLTASASEVKSPIEVDLGEVAKLFIGECNHAGSHHRLL